MTLSELMNGITINADFEGVLTNDDNILAVNTGAANASVSTYTVVQGAIAGVDAQLNPVVLDKQYIRSGLSTTKTGNQRSFAVTGDRYVGDAFQDYVFSHEKKYGTGEQVVTDYVWFCMLNGKGEKGKVSIIVNSDGSGVAGETSSIDILLKKTGAQAEAFNYAEAGV